MVTTILFSGSAGFGVCRLPSTPPYVTPPNYTPHRHDSSEFLLYFTSTWEQFVLFQLILFDVHFYYQNKENLLS